MKLAPKKMMLSYIEFVFNNIKAMPLSGKLVFLAMFPFMGVALVSYIYQLIYGHGVTDMSKPIFWGANVVNFVFFIGVSAGGIAIASLAHLANIEKFKPIGRLTEIVAIITVSLALIIIFLDLGKPEHMFGMFFHPIFASPLIWDTFVLNLYLMLCLVMLSTDLMGWHKVTKFFAIISIPVFIFVHSVTAWVFCLQKAQPAWHTTILAPLFISSALVSGLALVILAILFARRFLKFPVSDDVVISLGKYMRFVLPLLFYMMFCEIMTGIFSDVPSHDLVWTDLFTGRFSGFFLFDILGGILFPYLLMLTPLSKKVYGVAFVAVLALCGVFVERINIVIPSLMHPLMPGQATYMPNFIEVSILVGVYALGVVMFMAAAQLLPFSPVKTGGKK